MLDDPGRARYSTVERWPERLAGFEDLAFLFSSNQLSHGIASLQLDEAALLYRLARNVSPGAAVAEIGRFKGGSTLLLASALPEGAELWSYDLHVALRADLSGPELDADLRAALERFGLADRVHLARRRLPHGRAAASAPASSSSSTATTATRGRAPTTSAGASSSRPAGTSSSTTPSTRGGYGNHYPGVVRLMGEVGADPELERQPDAGSIAHFMPPLVQITAVVALVERP